MGVRKCDKQAKAKVTYSIDPLANISPIMYLMTFELEIESKHMMKWTNPRALFIE